MRAALLPSLAAAVLLASAACTSIVHVHEYHCGKPDGDPDTVYVYVGPGAAPESGEAPDMTQPGPGGQEELDPWISWYELTSGGARVETCTWGYGGTTRHTLVGNTVTGAGPLLSVGARVWKEDGDVSSLSLLLEFQLPSDGETDTGDTPGGAARPRPDVTAQGSSGGEGAPSMEGFFLTVRSGGEVHSFDIGECSSVEIDGSHPDTLVKIELPVGLEFLREISTDYDVTVMVSWPGSSPFARSFTEKNNSNMYQFFTLFVQGDGNPTLLPVER